MTIGFASSVPMILAFDDLVDAVPSTRAGFS
jgi:hypothetical protein